MPCFTTREDIFYLWMKLRAVLRSAHLHVLTWPTFKKNIHLFTSRGRRTMRLLRGWGRNGHFIFIPFGKFRITNFKAIFYMVIPGSDVSARSFLVPGREVLSAGASTCSTAVGQQGDFRPVLMLWLAETSGQKLHQYLRQNWAKLWVTTGCWCRWWPSCDGFCSMFGFYSRTWFWFQLKCPHKTGKTPVTTPLLVKTNGQRLALWRYADGECCCGPSEWACSHVENTLFIICRDHVTAATCVLIGWSHFQKNASAAHHAAPGLLNITAIKTMLQRCWLWPPPHPNPLKKCFCQCIVTMATGPLLLTHAAYPSLSLSPLSHLFTREVRFLAHALEWETTCT